MNNDNDRPQVPIRLSVPLAGTVSSARPLDGRRILSVEQPPDFQGHRLFLEHSPDGTTFSPFVRVERSPARLILLDLAGPRDGFIRVRLDEVQSNPRTFTLLTR